MNYCSPTQIISTWYFITVEVKLNWNYEKKLHNQNEGKNWSTSALEAVYVGTLQVSALQGCAMTDWQSLRWWLISDSFLFLFWGEWLRSWILNKDCPWKKNFPSCCQQSRICGVLLHMDFQHLFFLLEELISTLSKLFVFLTNQFTLKVSVNATCFGPFVITRVSSTAINENFVW